MPLLTDELQRKVAALCRPQAYPDTPARVEVVETHMSFVFLTPEHAYKLKKPVRYGFLDFSTLELRRRYCAEELRLNQRLAAGIYLAVVPLRSDPHGRLHIAPEGEIVEWLVQMRRLPQDRMLDERIRRGLLSEREIDALVERLARFYLAAEPEPVSFEQYRARLAQEIELDRRALQQHAGEFQWRTIVDLNTAHLAFLEDGRRFLEQRTVQHRIVEGHGDLRPEHVCLLEEPVVFDCIEFNRGFRIVDPLGELAYLAMECERIGAADVGSRLLNKYAARTGDPAPQPLIDFYKSRSASLRARLCLLHTSELERDAWGRWIAAASRYVALASAYAGVG